MKAVIIGNGAAGLEAALAIRKADAGASITMVSAESDFPFSRTALMYVSMGRMRVKDTEIFERSFYRSMGIDRVHGRADRIDPLKKEVLMEGGGTIPYDRLLLATGSESVPGFWPGIDLEGVLGYYSLADLARLEEATRTARRAVIVGGGLIGIEVAEVLLHKGIATTFLIREDYYWPIALCREEGDMITESLEAHGVTVRLSEEVDEIRGDGSRVKEILTNKGNLLPADVVYITVGVRPDKALAEASGITTNRGILVDRKLRTSAADIWAAGDCAEIADPGGGRGTVEQLWYTARRQGVTAGGNMAGRDDDYERGILYNAAKFLDTEYVTAGDVGPGPGKTHYYHRVPGEAVSFRLVFENGAITGFNILGSRWDTSVLRRFIREGMDLESLRRAMASAAFDAEFTRRHLPEALDNLSEINVEPWSPA